MTALLKREELHAAQGVECSQCGAGLIFSAELQAVACNFCGHALSVESLRRIDVIDPDFIVPFKTTSEAFHDAALRWLVSGHYVPIDVLAKANFAENLGVYIPCVFYGGSFTSDWSAQVGVERVETHYIWRDGRQVAQRDTHIDYFPQNGRANGEFAFVACASAKLDELQKQFVETLSFAGGEPFDERFTLGFAMESLTKQLSKKALFDNRVSDKLRERVDYVVASQISGEHVKDVRQSYRYSTEKEYAFSMPVWLLPYEYEGERHAIIMDGRNSTAITGTKPQDETQLQAVKKPFFIAAGILAAAIAGLIVAPAGSAAMTLLMGLFPAAVVMLLGAVLHRYVLLKSNLGIRERALAAFQSGGQFDIDEELAQLHSQRLSPKSVLLGSAIAAALALLATDVYGFFGEHAVAPSVDAEAEPSSSREQFTPEPSYSPPVIEANEEPFPENSEAPYPLNAEDAVPDIQATQPVLDQQTNQSEFTQAPPVPKPVASAPTRALPSSPSQSALVADTMQEARRCFAAENFDCADANLKIVLRLDPSSREARAMQGRIAQLRDEAMNSNWNAH